MLRDLQRKIADDVEKYLDNTARCNEEEGRVGGVLNNYAVNGITMEDIRLAIQTSDVGQMIDDYAQENEGGDK